MKTQEVVNGRALRLARRGLDGHWVRDAKTGRTLGVVWRGPNGRWHWKPAISAFRGDGRRGHESDGDLNDRVPSHLTDVTGVTQLRRDACELLIDYLESVKAPALGYGPHPGVAAWVMGGVEHE